MQNHAVNNAELTAWYDRLIVERMLRPISNVWAWMANKCIMLA